MIPLLLNSYLPNFKLFLFSEKADKEKKASKNLLNKLWAIARIK